MKIKIYLDVGKDGWLFMAGYESDFIKGGGGMVTSSPSVEGAKRYLIHAEIPDPFPIIEIKASKVETV